MPDESFHPLFSVITITYNAEQFLEDTIRSVAEQKSNYQLIEYIIVDGASTDGTMKIAEQYKSCIDKVVSEPDNGLYDAMNKGIDMATGDYLCFLNAGDKFHAPDTLKRIISTMPNTKVPDIIYGETAIVNNTGEFLHLRRLRAPEVLTWKSFKKGMLVCHQSFYMRKALAEHYNLKYRYSADFDWCIRMMMKSELIHNTHLTVIDYLDEGLTTNHRMDSLWERFHIMVHHYGILSTVIYHIIFVFRLLFLRSK
jgi:glycosyltransferase involved in cell wall biosynthesis